VVVTFDIQIPDRQIDLSVSLSRNSDASGGMSHLFEFRFAHPNDLPFGGISRVTGIAMKNAEGESGDDLIGSGLAIAPGSYMFGLLDVTDIAKENLRLLRTRALVRHQPRVHQWRGLHARRREGRKQGSTRSTKPWPSGGQ